METIIEKISSLFFLVIPEIAISEIIEDPSDIIFLACALAARAFFIIFGDSHLLALKKFQGISIVTP